MIVLCCSFFFTGCATDVKVHYTLPEKKLLPIVIPGEPIKIEVVAIIEGMSFTDLIKKERIPTETFVPRSKEQIVIYKRTDHYLVYYFKRNKLLIKKIYGISEWDEIKKQDNYPEKVYFDLGV